MSTRSLSTSPNRRSCGRTLPKIQTPEDPDPGHRGGRHAPGPDAGALARILGLIGGGETRVGGRTRRLRDRGDPVPDLEPSDGRRAEWLISSVTSQRASRRAYRGRHALDSPGRSAPEPRASLQTVDHPPFTSGGRGSDRSSMIRDETGSLIFAGTVDSVEEEIDARQTRSGQAPRVR